MVPGEEMPIMPSPRDLSAEGLDGSGRRPWPPGPSIVGAAAGSQGILAFLVSYGAGTGPPPDRPLTAWGEFCLHPEKDLKIFLVGSALTLVVVLGLYRARDRWARRPGPVPSDASRLG